MSFLDNTFYTFLALLIFFAIVIYMGAHKKIHAALVDRQQRIAKDLDDAAKLRAEAEGLLREYQQKRADAEKEAQSIIDQARREAASYAEETRSKLAETLARRTKQAEQKIDQAQAQALKDVKASATDAAITAATHLISQQTGKAEAKSLIDKSIAGLKTQLN